jgi:glycosyltransferase involved in cell wall biosynthesis
MIISYWTDLGNLNTSVGYGEAGYNICKSLVELGHKVPFDSPDAPVQMSFVQPEYYGFYDHQYKIGYTPWESTALPEFWLEHMEQCDEIWTTSPWVAKVYRDNGVTKPLYVYEHGVDKVWTPRARHRRNKLRFLHVGEPAPRKAAQLVLDVFREAFGDSDDVELTIKAHNTNTTRVRDRMGSIICTPDQLKNVNVITKEYSREEMVSLYQGHHVLVYPSWGEGFGFIPAQALATGMPTICTSSWAPYADWLGDLKVDSRLVDSPWEWTHTGQVYEPNADDLYKKMMLAYEDFENQSDKFFSQAEAFRTRYDWVNLTEKAFEHIVTKFS